MRVKRLLREEGEAHRVLLTTRPSALDLAEKEKSSGHGTAMLDRALSLFRWTAACDEQRLVKLNELRVSNEHCGEDQDKVEEISGTPVIRPAAGASGPPP